MTVKEVGCCGAYCKTCIKWQKEKYPDQRICRGCKLGYDTGERRADRAKCKIKSCCFMQKSLKHLPTVKIFPVKFWMPFGIRKDGNTNSTRNKLNSSGLTAITNFWKMLTTGRDRMGNFIYSQTEYLYSGFKTTIKQIFKGGKTID